MPRISVGHLVDDQNVARPDRLLHRPCRHAVPVVDQHLEQPDDRNEQDDAYRDRTGSRPHHFDNATRIPAMTMGTSKTVNV